MVDFLTVPEIEDYSRITTDGLLIGNFQTSSDNKGYVASSLSSSLFIGRYVYTANSYNGIVVLAKLSGQRCYINKGDNAGSNGFIVNTFDSVNSVYYTTIGFYFGNSGDGSVIGDNMLRLFPTLQELLVAFGHYSMTYSITYRDTNATHSGPAEAAVGDNVTVNYTFPDGYGIVNSSDIYVTNNGVLIPSTYADGTLTFTMPDPS